MRQVSPSGTMNLRNGPPRPSTLPIIRTKKLTISGNGHSNLSPGVYQGGISISEDPNIRFTYVPDNSSSLRAEAVDTAGHVFSGSWRSAGVEPVE